MSVTFWVSNELKSSEVNPIQSWNMCDVVVTWAVLKWLRSSSLSKGQYANIKLISVTESVQRYSMPWISVSFSSS